MRKIVCIAALSLALGAGLWAQEAGRGSPFLFGLAGVRWHFFWGLDLIPTGLDVRLGYRGLSLLPGLDTVLEATLGGGYEGFETYRAVDYTPNFQIPPDRAAGHDRNLEFNSPNFQWQLGLRQGILWNQEEGHNLLEGFVFYRGRYDRYLEGRAFWGTDPSRVALIQEYHSLWQQSYAGTDAYGIFGTSFLLGVDLNDLRHDDRTKAYDGLYAEGSFEASPWIPSVMGASDFWRLNVSARFFKVLYQASPQARKNAFTVYLGEYASLDYADAARSMPLYVMETFGGTELRSGLADSVRGFEEFSWDTQLKAVNNLEIRANLPSLYFASLVPGALAYFDIGYGRGYWGAPAPYDGAGGVLASTGVGVYLDVFDITYVRVYAHFPLIGARLDGAPWKLDIDFNLHF